MDNVKVSRFDVVKHLDSEEMIAEYLAAVTEEGDVNLLSVALEDVANARTRLSKESKNNV
jgi:probable addiction module antidote protein